MTRKINQITLIMVLMTPSFYSYAAYSHFTGNSWLLMCKDFPHRQDFMNATCEMYTKGAIEGFYWGYMASQAIESKSKKRIKPYCIKPTHTENQHILVIKKYMQENPEDLHRLAPWLIHAAMHNAFPCDED